MKSQIEEEKTQDFIGYPTNTLFGIVDDKADAEQVLFELASAGFVNDIRVFHGAEGVAQIDASGANHGWLAQLRRFHQKSTVEREHAERYELAVEQGHCVIAVQTGESERREQAREILKAHGGHFINYYGRFGIRKLDL